MKTKYFAKTGFTIAVTLLIMLATDPVFGQLGFAAGPKGGLSVTSFKGDDLDEVESKTNWFGGVFINLQIAPAFALQPELLLTERGAEVTSGNVRTDVSIKYFEVPILAKVRIPLANDVILPHILVGPNFGFKTDFGMSSTDTQTGNAITTSTGEVKSSDIGGLVGAGIDIQTEGSGVFFTLDGRYGFGFSDINDNDNMLVVKNVGWTFAVGLGFRIGKNKNDTD
jgi:hypothetical protein